MSNFHKGVLFAIIGATGWGISGVCSQFLFSEYQVSPSWLTSIRMIFSAFILLAIAFRNKKQEIFSIFRKKSDRRWLIAFATIGLLLCQYSFLTAIKYSNSGTTTVLQSLNIVMMAIIMAIWTRTKMSLQQTVAVILSILGVYLVATNGNPKEIVISTPGLIWGLISAVGVITYTLLSRGIIVRWGNSLITGWGMLIGGIVLGITTAVWKIPANLDIIAIIAVLVVVTIGTAISFSLFLESTKHIGPVKATLISCLEPAVATILSALCLGTKFTIIELIGFGAIISTVFLSVLEKPKTDATVELS